MRQPFALLLLYILSCLSCVVLGNWQLLDYRGNIIIGISMLAVGFYIYSELKRMEMWHERLSIDNNVKNTIFDLCLEGIYLEDEKGNILDCNRSGHEIFGYTRDEILAKSVADLVPEEIAKTFQETIPDDMTVGNKYVERVSKRKDGTVFPSEVNTNYVILDGEKRFIAYLRDITERKNMENELRLLAVKDDLTGIFNRRYIMDQLQRMLDRLKRYDWDFFSIAMLDIDDFKEINDKHGHVFGDEVLKYFSCMLKKSVRRVDMVGRYGGEEFLLILPYTSKAGGGTVLNRIREKAASLDFSRPVQLTFSAGLMEMTHDRAAQCDMDGILNRVDELMYKSKKEGKNRISCI